MSAIALQDVVNALVFILNEPSITGPVNVCSPNPTDNEGFTKAFGRYELLLLLLVLLLFTILLFTMLEFPKYK